jgi:hypothetical protein
VVPQLPKETVRKGAPARNGERTVTLAVKSAFKGDDARPARVYSGALQRQLYRICAGKSKQDAVQSGGKHFSERLGKFQPYHRWLEIAHSVYQTPCLGLCRGYDSRIAVTDRSDTKGRRGVEIDVTVRIENVCASRGNPKERNVAGGNGRDGRTFEKGERRRVGPRLRPRWMNPYEWQKFAEALRLNRQTGNTAQP